jgi:hypothetical protein
MKTPHKHTHSYDQFRSGTSFGASEHHHLKEVEAVMIRESHEKYKKTPEEREELKKMMYSHPAKHGNPYPYTQSGKLKR